MLVYPSLVKGRQVQDGHEESTHVFVIADEVNEDQVLKIARDWVQSGVLEPALWLSLNWIPPEEGERPNPVAHVFGRGSEPTVLEIPLLEALAREPHSRIVVTVMGTVGNVSPKELQRRLEVLLALLADSAPGSRNTDEQTVYGTRIRVMNLAFLPGDAPVPGIRDHIVLSDYSTVETYIVNPEDRPTPRSLDAIPRQGSDRWAPFLVSTAASVAGCWSSLAGPPIEPEVNWVPGNARVLRTSARVVLIHPLLAEVADSTRQVILGNVCAASAPGIQVKDPKLSLMSAQLLRARMDTYVDYVVSESGLSYREMEPFSPPSRQKRGLFEALRDFGHFAADRMRALPRWILQMRLKAFNQEATLRIYGELAELDIDVRRDLNRGVDDPVLVDAWDFVERKQEELAGILSSPIDPPEESSDPTPWVQIQRGIALFADGSGNEFPELQTESGIPLVAERLDDVVPPPSDVFVVDPECDELLGGDGTGQQVSWLDVEAASRLDGLLQRLASAKRQRLSELQLRYLEAEREFFDTLQNFMEARFDDEDSRAQFERETRIATVDEVMPSPKARVPDGLTNSPGFGEVDSTTMLVEAPSTSGPSTDADMEDEPEDQGSDIAEDLEQDEARDNEEQHRKISDPGSGTNDSKDLQRLIHPFDDPLDEEIATVEDLDELQLEIDRAGAHARRAQRLRQALNDICVDEAKRVRRAEHELKVLERTHGELGRWVERRTGSFVGRIMSKVRETGREMDAIFASVMETAHDAIPEYGSRSLEMQRQFVASILRGVFITLAIFLLLAVLNVVFSSLDLIPGFSGVPWWLLGVAFLVVLILVVLVPLRRYFQEWTRQKIRATDALSRLSYESLLVSHVRTERLRLAQLHMQVPQRMRALSCWWHYWEPTEESVLSQDLPELPSGEGLPFHLRWASSDWSESRVFRSIQEGIVSSMARPGYRSELIARAARDWVDSSDSGLNIDDLARARASDAVAVIEAWREDRASREAAAGRLERDIAREAQNFSLTSQALVPHVEILNPDPLRHLYIETDLLSGSEGYRTNTDEFLLEIAGPSAEMANRVWAAGIGNPPFESFFAGPARLSDRVSDSVRYVDVESSKVCSSEVSVRIDITDQVLPRTILNIQIDTQESEEPGSQHEARESDSEVEAETRSLLGRETAEQFEAF